MNNNRTGIIVMTLLMVLALSACSNSSRDSEAEQFNPESSPSSSEDSTNTKADQETTAQKEKVEGSVQAKDEEAKQSDQTDSEATESTKKAFLDKLNKMEEADRYAEPKDTTAGLEEQEQERFNKWDKVLNQIYGVLQEQLSKEDMDSLREEQRDWVQQRDEKAKQASLKYEGGSMESLEYVATQATLTRERAFELVAHYMK